MSERDAGADKPFQFTDRRRFDPATGARRTETPAAAAASAGGPAAPGSPAADPGNLENAAQPLDVAVSSTGLEQAQLDQAQQEAAERTADLQRVSAEYANYRKRVDRDREQVVAVARSSVITELLVVLDDVDRAQAHGDLVGAFKVTADKLSAVLTKLGLERVGAPGDTFDPAQHDAVQFATSAEVSEPTVTEVLRAGYAISERLVRPAVVVVTGPELDARQADPTADTTAGAAPTGDAAPDQS